MCGFVAVIQNSRSGVDSLKEELILSLLQKVLYRGPDAQGVLSLERFGAGMCQFKTRGLIQAIPVQIGDDYYVYNGEVFGDFNLNTEIPYSLSEELKLLFDKPNVDGMYSGIKWFGKENHAQIIRDRFGILPMYYKKNSLGIEFASDLSAFPKFKTSNVNISSLHEMFVLGNSIGCQTLYPEIMEVPPGTNKIFFGTSNKFGTNLFKVHSNDVDEIELALTDAVNRCSFTSEKLGVAISGGLDSCIIFQLLNELKKDITSYSIRYDSDGCSHNRLMSKTSRHIPHFYTDFKPHRILDTIDGLVDIYNGPITLSSALLTFQLATLIQQHGVRVLLSGEGADELFFGYSSYQHLSLSNLNVNKAILDFYLTDEKKYWYERFLGRETMTCLRSKFQEEISSIYYELPENKFRHFEFNYSLSPLLKRNDLIFMHFGIESRAPFLHGLVPEFAWKRKYRDLKGKQVLHKIQQRYSESDIRLKKKSLQLKFMMDSKLSKYMQKYIEDNMEILEELGFRYDGIIEYFNQKKFDDLYILLKLYSTVQWRKKILT